LNPGFAQHRLEYSINGGEYQSYTGQISLAPNAYASGFAMVARSTPAGEGFVASPEAGKVLSVKLRKPGIEIAAATGVQAGSHTVVIENPNPQGTSEIYFAVRNEATGSTTSYQLYRDAFPLIDRDYPEGYTVLAYAAPVRENFLASDEATSFQLTFFGIPVTGSTIFVLDRSGSMAWDDGLGQVKEEMNRVLDLLTTTDKFGIIQFSSTAEVVMSWSSATATRVSTAKRRVNGMTANGYTNYSAALSLALDAARKNEVKQVVFLSDGVPTAGDTRPSAILSLVRQIVAEGTRVDTLAFGRITNDGRDLLDRMDAAGDLPR
jgi:hypothetical protein